MPILELRSARSNVSELQPPVPGCDPDLLSLHNCDTPKTYREALRIAALHSVENTRSREHAA
jgi:hypothetical protein